ncbi:hypothetical protein [Pantoea sp. UYEF8]|uniref:hypothetical protein n=1 Tax=Pantoea sp. UYEF8 TaxID=1756394 RepID=UPI003399FBF8
MKIQDKTKRTVRLELTTDDLLEIFVDKTGMGDIDDFRWLLGSKDGDRELNSGITGIVIIADNLEKS